MWKLVWSVKSLNVPIGFDRVDNTDGEMIGCDTEDNTDTSDKIPLMVMRYRE